MQLWQFNKSNHNQFFYVFLCLRSVWVSTTLLRVGSEQVIDSECVMTTGTSSVFAAYCSARQCVPLLATFAVSLEETQLWVTFANYEVLRLFFFYRLPFYFFLQLIPKRGRVWHSHLPEVTVLSCINLEEDKDACQLKNKRYLL